MGGDRERTSNKTRSSGNTSTNFTSERNTQSEHDRDRSGDSQQHRASVFSRLGKGPVGGTNSSKTSTASSQKGICRPWAETGQCPYGNECRFKHVSSLVSPSKRSGTSNDGKETKDKERESGSRPIGHREETVDRPDNRDRNRLSASDRDPSRVSAQTAIKDSSRKDTSSGNKNPIEKH